MNQVAFIADQVAHWNAGTERQMLLLGNELVARGWRVNLLVFRPSMALQDGSWEGDIEVLNITRLASPASWLKARNVARRLRDEGFSVAQCFLNDAAMLMPVFLKQSGVACIVSRRDMGFWYTPGQLCVLRAVRRFVDRLVANSQAVADSVCRVEGFEREKVEVIYNGLSDCSMPEDRKTDSAELVVGIVANVKPVKRLQDAIQAFAQVATQFPDVTLRLVGEGATGGLAELASNLGIANSVSFAGQVTDPLKEIVQFDVALLTSESEGFSNAIMEYMQCGKPVICSNTGGNPELVEDGVSGFLYPVGDIDGLAQRLSELLTNEAKRQAMGEAGKARLEKLCNRDRIVSSHMALYESLAKSKAAKTAGAAT